LPSKPGKAMPHRNGKTIEETIEAEAMPPPLLRQLVEEAIKSELPEKGRAALLKAARRLR
jgi:hypothetical protein